MTAPDLAPFRQFVDPINNPADLALVQTLLKNASSTAAALYPATAYRVIADARYVNTGAFMVRGLDLSATYPTTIGDEQVTFTASASKLFHYQRKVTPSAQAVDLAGVATYPADLQVRAAATWTHGPINTTFGLRHTDKLTIQGGGQVKGQTTADLQVQYVAPAKSGPWKGLSLALSVQNLFDQDPPFYDSVAGVGYDPSNYDPMGRIVALQLTKTW
ncbi:hypothetical protein ACRAWD_05520 [Caulobacter segnis]